MAIKLCNLSPDIFRANASANGGDLARADIVAVGRMLMADRAGRDANALRLLEKRSTDYTPMLNDKEYSITNENLKRKMCLFAARMSASQLGEEAPGDYEAFLKEQRKFMCDPTFLRVLSGIIRDIVTPIIPATMSNALDWLCQTVPVPIGQTYELDVLSNDIFVFEDDSFGASGSKPRNHAYAKTITLNPTKRTAAVSIKWYQLVGNSADLGRLMNSIYAGLYSKVVAVWNKAMVAGAGSTVFTPTGLTFPALNDTNWTKAVKRTAMANGVSFRDITAFGDLEALSKVLPSGNVNAATVNLDAALSTMLGAEWVRYGYLGEYRGARLMPIENVVVPGTQNTTVSDLLPNNCIYFAATNGAKPVYLGIEEGAPIEIVMTPAQTADMTINMEVGVSMEAKTVFGSKIGYMSPV